MEFQVLSNEHTQQNFQSQGLLGGTLSINRIRLVDTSGTPIDYDNDLPTTALVELRSSNSLRVQVGENPPKYQVPENFQTIMVSSSNSTPKVDGRYTIDNVGGSDGLQNTFTLRSVVGDGTFVNDKLVGSSGFNEPDITQTWASFTNGTKAYVNFGAEGGGKAALITQNFEREIAAHEYALGDNPGDHTAAENM